MSNDPTTAIGFFIVFGTFGLWFAIQSHKGDKPGEPLSLFSLFSRRYTSADEKSVTGLWFGILILIISLVMIGREIASLLR